MRSPLKPLSEQVVVITGATSGVGLATARAMAARGAKLVLAARNAVALEALALEIRAGGGRAEYAVADVGDLAQMEAVAAKARQAFGGFDTFVNNAGVTIYGLIEDTPLDDQRRLFDTNYWGVVHGSLLAAEHLRTRDGGGVIVNVGSVLSDLALPIQGVYAASKHAVKGFTNALRAELARGAPDVTVTLVKPSALDTPSKEHGKSLLGAAPTNPPPVYSVGLAADAIVYAAEHRTRELTVGGGGRVQALFGQLLPGVAEPMLGALMPVLSRERKGAKSQAEGGDCLHAHSGRDLKERASYSMVRNTSLYTAAQLRPRAAAGVLAGVGAALFALSKARQGLRLAEARAEGRKRERRRWEARADTPRTRSRTS